MTSSKADIDVTEIVKSYRKGGGGKQLPSQLSLHIEVSKGRRETTEGTKSTLDNIIVLNLVFFFVILMSTNPSLTVYILFVVFKLEPKIKR
jgi:hypothetical protein